jgi:hypothetical protein
VTLDILTDALVLVGQHGVLPNVRQRENQPWMQPSVGHCRRQGQLPASVDSKR